jgi:hypothetical protein
MDQSIRAKCRSDFLSFFRQVSNLSTTKEHILWFVLIEWKRMNVCCWWSLRNMIWLTKEESSRASVESQYLHMDGNNRLKMFKQNDTNLFLILNRSIMPTLFDKIHMGEGTGGKPLHLIFGNFVRYLTQIFKKSPPPLVNFFFDFGFCLLFQNP